MEAPERFSRDIRVYCKDIKDLVELSAETDGSNIKNWFTTRASRNYYPLFDEFFKNIIS